MYSAEPQYMFKILRSLYQPIYFRNRIKLRINPPKIKTIGRTSKESWSKGPGFGLPLKGAVLLKTVEVKSA